MSGSLRLGTVTPPPSQVIELSGVDKAGPCPGCFGLSLFAPPSDVHGVRTRNGIRDQDELTADILEKP